MLSRIEHLGFFLLRAPSLPLHEIQKINAIDNGADLGQSLYNLLIANPAVLQAISFANKELYNSYLEWLKEGRQPNKKLLLTLYKYVARMASRPTPFGSFAGICMGTVNDGPNTLRLSDRSETHTRLSMDYLVETIHLLRGKEESLKGITFYTNNSINTIGGYFRYIRYENVAGKKRFFQIRLKKNPLLEVLYEYAKEGRPYDELIAFLVDFDIERERVTAYLSRLVDNQFLVWELEPPVVGEDQLAALNHKLKEMAGDSKELQTVRERLSSNLGEMPIEERNTHPVLLQADKKFIPEKVQLKQSAVQLIADELCELHPLFQASIPRDLQVFAEKFKRRYDMMDVPLLEVLDGDVGIGYGDLEDQYKKEHPLISDLHIRKDKKTASATLEDQAVVNGLLGNAKHIDLEKIHTAFDHKNQETTVAPTFYTIGNLLANCAEDLDKGNFQFNVLACSGSSAINLMSRFAYMDEALKENLKRCARYEESCFEEAVLADIVHMPEGKLGNILQRPSLYSYEIPILGATRKDDEQQILLSDLSISVRNNQILLFSRKLNKRVIPRLSCAHNFQQGISIYRFLSDLQYQDTPFSIHWKWDKYKETPFLPRVIYKHLILSRARWYVRKCAKAHQEGKALIKRLQVDLTLPNEVLIAEGDNELYINLQTPWGIQLLLDKLALGDVTLYESVAQQSPIVANTQGQSFVNELILPFKSIVTADSALYAKPALEKTVKRRFLPGSEWIYLKLYCAQKSADELLTNNIAELVEQLTNEGLIDKWFFVRYHDPDFHIRLRFLAAKKNKQTINKIQQIIRVALEYLTIDNKVWTVQHDTYTREIERYGSDNMELCESVFAIDSTAVLCFLQRPNKEDATTPWLFGLKATDQLLELFGFSLSERFELTESWSLALSKEFDLDKKQQKQINLNYRHSSAAIAQVLKNDVPQTAEPLFKDIFDKRYCKLFSLLATRRLRKSDKSKLIGSLSHMFLNKLFFSDQRANEMVVYFYLAKHYRSTLARIGKAPRLEKTSLVVH
ncbi:lantibiotic dehydratase [Olivibacter sp. XZL3]|uniref:lantibiotic dehydratase n=1 Tax=Olivibacter sp. XZL3 TaxID=1735116 RepID=UPI001065F601|nr:lantibiotic dehydratase [Olivibacter sp. XZL3]